MEYYGVIVREATQQDIPDINRVTHAAFLKYQQDLGLTGKVSALEETVADVERDMQTKRIFVGSLEGKTIGSVRFEVLGEVAYLSRFGVLDEYQGSGMGGILMRCVQESCRNLGVKAIALHTSARMTYLVCFYYRNGYFVHSTSTGRGYIRALLVNELCKPSETYDLAPVMSK